MMTIPCTLPRSRNSLFDLSKQHFTDQPVESTPVNRSEHEVNTPKHSYVGAMEEAQEPDRDILPINQLVNTPFPSALLTVNSYPK